MPRTASSPARDSADSEGRANQKRRTRKALIDAAIALREEGRNPSFAEVAERALVSRATAYRYFSSVEALITETGTDQSMHPLERFWKPGEDPAEGVGRAARELTRLLLDDESGLHVMERSFMTVWLENEPQERPLRPGRRMAYIEPIVETLKDSLSPAARRRLQHALCLAMGTEAVIALRDVGRASVPESLEAAAWAARALVRQALAESQVAPARGAVTSRTKRAPS